MKATTARNAAYLLLPYAALTTVLLAASHEEISALKREREAHNWRYFTCRTLLDDPQTRAIMDAKWVREDAQLACTRATKKAAGK